MRPNHPNRLNHPNGLNHPNRLSRCALLRGAGAALALPWLEALAPASRPPVRLAFLFMPNGVLPRPGRRPNSH